ncbi:SDR family NAD(P)-dependent oxidoreductase [Lapidilactobacillus wuchangensis]|uniref:SDR family NAD(P)-dependent oxidoreductase n=1 Tax=Lapidilactobacillus wuchangensis TaxID=2486001 RepID=UPI001CDC807A|nr:SDR family NAD(P)-dependent oxidoreductase [Lapidilactobacillus wuchangensis]
MSRISVAIITGATSGLGTAYIDAVIKECPDVDQIWLVARRKQVMAAIAAKHPKMTFKIVPLDLSERTSYLELNQLLAQEQPQISALIANAGLAYNGSVDQMQIEKIQKMIDLNVNGTTSFIRTCLPYLTQDSFILLVSSASSFVPNPNLAVYSATKAYLTSFGLALREELKPRQIKVCTVMPGRMKTEMDQALNQAGRSGAFNLLPSLNIPKFARKTIQVAQAGCASYTMMIFYKAFRVVAKLVPQKLLVPLTKI